MKPVECLGCGFVFDIDPPYQVVCPECKAQPGTYCKRPSGHSGPFVGFHAVRDVEALKLGCYDHQGMGDKCGPHSSSERAKSIIKNYQLGE